MPDTVRTMGPLLWFEHSSFSFKVEKTWVHVCWKDKSKAGDGLQLTLTNMADDIIEDYLNLMWLMYQLFTHASCSEISSSYNFLVICFNISCRDDGFEFSFWTLYFVTVIATYWEVSSTGFYGFCAVVKSLNILWFVFTSSEQQLDKVRPYSICTELYFSILRQSVIRTQWYWPWPLTFLLRMGMKE